jgi:purine nucleosidase
MAARSRARDKAVPGDLTTMHPIPVIIDCDPGQDDAIAILLALSAPDRLNVLGVTTVAGNVALEKTQRNARIVCEWAGRPDIAVYAGCERPMLRSPIGAGDIHGREGLQGPALHEPTMPLQPAHAVDFLIDTLSTHDGRVTLCGLGPLTNLAVAIAKRPGIVPNIERIVVMGGAASEGGNITPCAEFNFHADPHAAKSVLACGAPIVMMPLDATHQVTASGRWTQSLRSIGTRAAERVADIIEAYSPPEAQRFGEAGAPLHDPCVIAFLLAPELFSARLVNVCVETTSSLTLGESVVDWWGVTARRPNVRYVNRVNRDAVLDLLLGAFGKLP